MLPRVVVGGPVRNREHILLRYLAALEQLNYPRDRLRFAWLVNDSADQTEVFLAQWLIGHADDYDGMLAGWLWRKDYGVGPWRRGEYAAPARGRSERFSHLAELRNEVVERLLALHSTWAWDYYWALDSDQLPPPGALRQLVSNGKDVVCGITPVAREEFFNVLEESQSSPGTYVHIPEARLRRAWERGRLLEVGAVGGGVDLIHRRVFEAGVRYQPHDQGEGIGFSIAARKQGFKLYCNPSVIITHILGEGGS